MRRPVTQALALAFVFMLAHSATAQIAGSSEDRAVQANGVSVVKRKPDTLRLQIEISAKAKTLKEAIEKLKAVREKANSELAKMGVAEGSIKLDDAHLNTAVSAQQQQMEMMVRQRMRQGGRKSKKLPEKPITVSSNLTAEWKLKGATPEELLLEAAEIESKVRAADLAGAKAAEEESAEEEEAAEEMAEMNMYNDSNQLKPGEPIFIYVSKISKEDLAKARADAFAQAKAEASQLSAAAGAMLGPLQALSSHASMEQFANGMYRGYSSYNDPRQQFIMQMMAESQQNPEKKYQEAIGSQPHDVNLSVMVNATFALELPK